MEPSVASVSDGVVAAEVVPVTASVEPVVASSGFSVEGCFFLPSASGSVVLSAVVDSPAGVVDGGCVALGSVPSSVEAGDEVPSVDVALTSGVLAGVSAVGGGVFLLVGSIVGSCVVPGISSPSQLYISGQHSPSGIFPGMQFGAGGRQTFSAHITSPSKQRQYLQASGGGTSSPNLKVWPW